MEPDRSGSPFWFEMRWVIPVITAILLLPPILGLFDRPVAVFGVPLLPLYMFAVWAVAIGLCAVAGRHALPSTFRSDRQGR